MLKMTGRLCRLPAYSMVLAVSILLMGCVGPVNMQQPIKEGDSLEVGKGVVVARVINASSYPLPFNQLTITPENLNQSKAIKPERMLAAKKVNDGSTVFASSVKAGNYSLGSLRAFHVQGEYIWQYWIPADVSLGSFSVASQQITDLGTLIYYPKLQGDKGLKTVVRMPDSATGEVLEKYFPFQPYDATQLLSWNEDGFEMERQNAFVSVLQNPVSHEDSYLTPSGAVIFPSKLGVIIERDKDGQWLLDAVDTSLPLSAVAENTVGDRVVGGSEGKLFLRRSGGQWSDVSLGSTYFVEHLEFMDDNTIDLIARQELKLTVFRATLDEGELDWKAINAYDSVNGWEKVSDASKAQKDNSTSTRKNAKPRYIASAIMDKTLDKPILSVYTKYARAERAITSGKAQLFTYDPQSWATQKIRTSEKASEVDAIIDAGAVKFGLKRPSLWGFSSSYSYFLQDPATQQWNEIKSSILACRGWLPAVDGLCQDGKKERQRKFNFQSVPWFSTANDGVAVAGFTGRSKRSDGERSDTQIIETSDGGQTWLLTTRLVPEPYCTDFVNHFADKIILSCDGVSGDFYESVDSAATWIHVREHQDF